MEGKKDDEKKTRWDLLIIGLREEIKEVVEVLDFGARKYSDNGWKKLPGIRRRYLAACMRHIVAWLTGERFDRESGKNHLSHAVCCLLFILWADRNVSEAVEGENPTCPEPTSPMILFVVFIGTLISGILIGIILGAGRR